MTQINFDRLYFGRAAAENEAEVDPDRFYRSFVDLWEIPEEVRSGEVFLLTGPKGAGKSAVAKYLEMDLARRHGLESTFVDVVNLDELQRSTPSAMAVPRLEASEARRDSFHLSDAAWKLFIGIRLLESLLRDQGCSLQRNPHFLRLRDDMKQAGLVADDFPQVLRKVRKKNISLHVPKLVDRSVETTDSDIVNVQQLGEALFNHIVNVETSSVHTLVIDGLDRAIVGSEIYWESLSSLIRTAEVMHKRLRKAASFIRLLVLCRTDLFSRVRSPDTTKIREDWGRSIDWQYGTNEATESRLWELVERKASVDLDRQIPVIDEFFPRRATVGPDSNPRHIEIHEYLLQFTRHTPRDILQLMREVKRAAPRVVSLTNNQVRAGINNYCREYFLEEVRAEMRGLLPDAVPARLPELVQAVGMRVFTREDFVAAFARCGLEKDADADSTLGHLFLSGAIGNLIENGRQNRIQFYHRRNTAQLDVRGKVLFHSALVYGLNLRWN